MGCSDLERLRKAGLIELVLRLQRPETISRTSSKPPSSDREVRRAQAKPGGAKPGHEGHSRTLSPDPDEVVADRPGQCPCCGGALAADLPAESVGVCEQIDVPEGTPLITPHQRLAVRCPSCGTRVVAPVPQAAAPHAVRAAPARGGDVPEDFQAPSDGRLQVAMADPFGLNPQPGRADELAPPRPRAVPHPSRGGGVGAAPGRIGDLGRDRRPHRKLQRLALGLPLGRGGGAPRRVTNGYRAMWAAAVRRTCVRSSTRSAPDRFPRRPTSWQTSSAGSDTEPDRLGNYERCVTRCEMRNHKIYL
ncbi:hypothetical protein OPKNFCMD_3799 [Methylobacterium crusticola]|uniref:Transposase IS66 zinc-finger binding domain-containing protein n=1 Tax=Methylobacterium crusticola TaxID=1697972 RepID=A0ABQ4R0H8_9HYPH|nr:hypothetical protein OPKNFCMD_3799 [Methylobacterium crusticola]